MAEDGTVVPYNEDEAPEWENSRAVTIRAPGEQGSTVLVALVRLDAAPEPFHADYEAGRVSTPSSEFGLKEFQNSYFRSDADGSYVGTFMAPAWMQLLDARKAGSEAHVADITALVEVTRRGERISDQIDWRMFDIAVSGETDGLTAEEALARSRFHNEAPLHQVHGLQGLASIHMEPADELDEIDGEVGNFLPVPHLVLDGWQEIRVFPQYLIDGVRAIFRRFLADRIGDTPIEEIVRIQHWPGEMQAICEVFEHEGFEDMGVSAPFADNRVMRGGYATSEVRNFRGNGCDIIVFEDFAGSYAYAWPEQIRADLENNQGLRR
jgi:hypothetical protein